MNVELKLENVAVPKITAPDQVIVRVGAAGCAALICTLSRASGAV